MGLRKDKKKEVTKKAVLKALEDVADPEVGVDVVNLGLIYDVKVEKNKIYIKMTFTTPTCPLGMMILSSVNGKIYDEFGILPEVELVFDPPWSPEMMSEKAKKKLGYEGEKDA